MAFDILYHSILAKINNYKLKTLCNYTSHFPNTVFSFSIYVLWTAREYSFEIITFNIYRELFFSSEHITLHALCSVSKWTCQCIIDYCTMQVNALSDKVNIQARQNLI